MITMHSNNIIKFYLPKTLVSRVFKRNIHVTSRLLKNVPEEETDEAVKEAKRLQALLEFQAKPRYQHPVKRTANIFKRDFKYMGRVAKNWIGIEDVVHDPKAQFFPTHTDVVVIGSGATGASVAYWLSQRTRQGMGIIVIDEGTPENEEDRLTYVNTGTLCHQHVLPEKVQMSLFCAEHFKNFHKEMKIDGFPEPDILYEPYGSLFLANEANDGCNLLTTSSIMQNRLGAHNVLLYKEELKQKFPWLNVEDIDLGCLGMDSEGRFDTVAMVNACKQKSINYGVEFIEGTVLGFDTMDQPLITAPSVDGKYEQLERVIFQCPNGDVRAITFAFCVLAAGHQCGKLARRAKVGEAEGLLAIDLPIEPVERSVHYFTCADGPKFDLPYIVDPSGIFIQRVGLGGTYVTGVVNDNTPSKDFEPFKEKLINRIPAFKNLELQATKTGKYEYNYMDESGVFGLHPYHLNLVFATGFCGHSVQFAPAIGRAVNEILLDGNYTSINLSRFNFDRLCLQEPLLQAPIAFDRLNI